MPREEIGTFTEWLHGETSRLQPRVAMLGAAGMAELREENGDEDDPHWLLDYSLGGAYDQPPYVASDLDLNWVEAQDGSPYSYGLVDARGAWLIPLGKQYLSVRPFRDGIAEVILNQEAASYAGHQG